MLQNTTGATEPMAKIRLAYHIDIPGGKSYLAGEQFVPVSELATLKSAVEARHGFEVVEVPERRNDSDATGHEPDVPHELPHTE